MSAFLVTIGLETHVQLATRAKLFCACANAFGAEPNRHTCSVCTGRPGALPVLNHAALAMGLRVALALHAEIPPVIAFDRKNYFYPDLPKGYQITQFEHPVGRGGRVDLEGHAPVFLERVHLEEDAGKSVHDRGPYTLVDLNRAGVPLLEIVTRPVLTSPEHAEAYLRTLRELVRYLEVSDGDMEKGSLRCDVNVSLRADEAAPFGTKVEVKNLNSFRMVARAIAFEVERQGALLARGEPVHRETRSWDDGAGRTLPMRSKEEAMDYRYFREPDLPPFRIPVEWVEETRAALPELARAKRARYREVFGLSAYDADVLTAEVATARYFEEVIAAGADAKAAANWIANRLAFLAKERGGSIAALGVSPDALARLVALTEEGRVNRRSAEEVLDHMIATGRTAEEIVEERGLSQIRDEGELLAICRATVAARPDVVAQIRGGKEKALGALVGQVMKETAGRADPLRVREYLTRCIEETT